MAHHHHQLMSIETRHQMYMNHILRKKSISKETRRKLGRINVRELTKTELKTLISSFQVRRSDLHGILKGIAVEWQRWLLAYHLPESYYVGANVERHSGGCRLKHRILPDLDLLRELHGITNL